MNAVQTSRRFLSLYRGLFVVEAARCGGGVVWRRRVVESGWGWGEESGSVGEGMEAQLWSATLERNLGAQLGKGQKDRKFFAFLVRSVAQPLPLSPIPWSQMMVAIASPCSGSITSGGCHSFSFPRAPSPHHCKPPGSGSRPRHGHQRRRPQPRKRPGSCWSGFLLGFGWSSAATRIPPKVQSTATRRMRMPGTTWTRPVSETTKRRSRPIQPFTKALQINHMSRA